MTDCSMTHSPDPVKTRKHATVHKGEPLTPREMEVARHIADGLDSKTVAAKLFIAKRTVDFHLANIYAKMEVDNRVQMLRAARLQGLLDAPTGASGLCSAPEETVVTP